MLNVYQVSVLKMEFVLTVMYLTVKDVHQQMYAIIAQADIRLVLTMNVLNATSLVVLVALLPMSVNNAYQETTSSTILVSLSVPILIVKLSDARTTLKFVPTVMKDFWS